MSNPVQHSEQVRNLDGCKVAEYEAEISQLDRLITNATARLAHLRELVRKH